MSDRTEFLTVAEAMAYLRLGRTTVYAQARRYEATGGAEGLPCRRFGRSLRFPLAELQASDHGATPLEPRVERPRPRPRPEPTTPRSHQRSRTTRTTATEPSSTIQSELPFTS